MNEPDRVIITAALRTPVGRVGGVLDALGVEKLVAPLIQRLLSQRNIDAGLIDEVIVGNAAGPGGNPARLASLEAGLPVAIPGLTVDRQCGSGLEAINLGAQMIRSGAAQLVLAGGVESTSTSPRTGRARFSPARIGDPDMGIAAENVADRYRVSRQRQDAWALRSHQRTTRALRSGLLAAEIVPLETDRGVVTQDECPRADCSASALAALQPVFLPNGTVTAGNACPVNDGAAMVLMQRAGPETDLTGIELIASAAAGVDPNYLGIGPVPAVKKVLLTAGVEIDDVQRIELNEAFAAQVLACLDQLGLPHERVNQDGGALAVGHPYGASGALLVTRLFHTLQSQQVGLATLGIGGGLGLATLFRAI